MTLSSSTKPLSVLPLEPSDRGWRDSLLAERWGESLVVSRGTLHDASRLPGFKAVIEGRPAGHLTFRFEGDACEIVTLDSIEECRGVGTALMEAVRREAGEQGCRRIWLITTNDNLHAIGFYQRRGYRLCALHAGALETSRRLKPSIPLIGMNGIPLRDELEFELLL